MGGCYIAATPVVLQRMVCIDRFVAIRLNANDTSPDLRAGLQADADREPVAAVVERWRIPDRTDCRTKQASADMLPALGRTVLMFGMR